MRDLEKIDRLLSEGEALPEVTWDGKISWRKGDPVKKPSRKFKVLDNRHNKMAFKKNDGETGRPISKGLGGIAFCCA